MRKPIIPQTKSLKYRSFELMYREAALPLMKFLVKRMGGDVAAAQDVFQDTALAALKGYYTFEHKSAFFTWICRIGLNKTADYYRAQISHESRIVAPFFEEIASIGSNELSYEEKLSLLELRDNVKECLNLLPDEKRELLHMRYWLDMPIKAIAEKLGISERAAEGKVYRAKLEFREIVASKYPDIY